MPRISPTGRLMSPSLVLLSLGMLGCGGAGGDVAPDSISPAPETDHAKSCSPRLWCLPQRNGGTLGRV